MLLTFPEGDILIDQKPILRNLRINIAPNRQLRAKFEVFPSDPENQDPIPVDLVVYEYKYRVDGITSIAIVAKGQERNTCNNFQLTLSLDVLKHKVGVKGNYGQKAIREVYNNFGEVANVVKAFI